MKITFAVVRNQNIFHFLPSIYHIHGAYEFNDEHVIVIGWLSLGVGIGYINGKV